MKKVYILLFALFALSNTNGQGWQLLSPIPALGGLYSVCFIPTGPGTNAGYAVGSYGTIIKTIDGGSTWTASSPGQNTGLRAVFFNDDNTGFVAGDSGSILRTTDGGVTWAALYGCTFNLLRSIFFVNSNTGYIAGCGGTILNTTDGGGFGVGIEQNIQSNSIEIYPNPANSRVTFSSNSNLPGENNISIFNSTGRQLLSKKFRNQNKIEMDVSQLTKGIYLVKMQTNAGVEARKLVIQ